MPRRLPRACASPPRSNSTSATATSSSRLRRWRRDRIVQRFMNLGIAGKTALVCGASRGLGRACAEALAREGVNLVIVARTREVLEHSGAAIAQATDVKVSAVAADLTTAAGRDAAIAACPAPDI